MHYFPPNFALEKMKAEYDGLVQDRNAVLPNCFNGDKWQGKSALRYPIADFRIDLVA